jgi:hypothetical protein
MSSSRFGFSLLAAALVTAGFAPALAQAEDFTLTRDTGGGPAHHFGDEGQIAISSDAALSISHRTGGTTEITLAPALDYFVIKNLSVGGIIEFDYTKAGDASSSRFGIGPRVGYNIPLSDLVSLWPKLGFSYAHTSNTISVKANGVTTDLTSSSDGIALNLFVPFMFHPAEHFFAGFGPFLDADLSGDNKVTVYGLKLTLGGWLTP